MRLNVHPEMLSEASQKLNLLIAVVGALLCVSPLFSRQDHSSVKNNFEVTLVVDPLLQRSTILHRSHTCSRPSTGLTFKSVLILTS
jgi:hypothetical protein